MSGKNCFMKVSTPGCRGADAQATRLISPALCAVDYVKLSENKIIINQGVKICSMRVGNPARRGEDAQVTTMVDCGMRAGVRCGPPAPLKQFSAPRIHQQPGRLACRRTVPHTRSAPGKPISGNSCSMKACAVGIHGCKSALVHVPDRSISSNMARYSPQSIGQGRGDIEFSLLRLPTAQASMEKILMP